MMKEQKHQKPPMTKELDGECQDVVGKIRIVRQIRRIRRSREREERMKAPAS